MADFDICIIGAGVVGLSVARNLSQKGLSVLIVEKHERIGTETSSRNSQVIHAGMYYPDNSLKAKLCVDGNQSLYEYCFQRNIPHKRIGKYIIATDREEETYIQKIFEQGKKNGVENLQFQSQNEILKKEPNIKTVGGLYSPDTGILDVHPLMESYLEEAREHGAELICRHEVIRIIKINDGYEIELKSGKEISSIKVKSIVNSAGLQSDKIAELAGFNTEKLNYQLTYCKGHYFRVKNSDKYSIHHLIYPAPQKNLSGLGVHLTLDLDGSLRLGPDVKYLEERKQDYTIDSNLADHFFNAVKRYLPELQKDEIYPDTAGIRPKLQKEGEPFRDFIIKEESENGFPLFINLIGIESPGLTCSLEIARMVGSYF